MARHDGDRGVGSGPNAWTCIRHLKAMLFAQIAGLNSLREIVDGLQVHPGGLYHLDLRIPRRSTLSDAQANRPVAVFRDICETLIGQASREVRKEGAAVIQLIDSTPIVLRDTRVDWAEANHRVRGLKLHVCFDPRAGLTDWIDITSPKINDCVAAHAMPIVAGATYVMDKGYLDFGLWSRFCEAGAFFVTRLKKNTKRRNVRARIAEGAGVLEDNELEVGMPKPRGGALNPLVGTLLREVVVERQGKAPLRLVTNDLNRPAAEVADLYKERWQIELLFKWLKQNLKIRRFVGRSEKAVKIQIYCAIIAFLLMRMMRQTSALALRAQPKALATRLKVALCGRFDLTGRAKPPPRQPASLPSPQFTLPFAPT